MAMGPVPFAVDAGKTSVNALFDEVIDEDEKTYVQIKPVEVQSKSVPGNYYTSPHVISRKNVVPDALADEIESLVEEVEVELSPKKDAKAKGMQNVRPEHRNAVESLGVVVSTSDQDDPESTPVREYAAFVDIKNGSTNVGVSTFQRALPLLVSTAVTGLITAGAHRIEITDSLSKLSVQGSVAFVRDIFSMTTLYSLQSGVYNIIHSLTGRGASGNFGATYAAGYQGGVGGVSDGHGALQVVKDFWVQVWNFAPSLIHTYDNDSMFMTTVNEKIHLNWQNIQYNALYVFSAAFRKAVQEHQHLQINTKAYDPVQAANVGGAATKEMLTNMFANLYARNVANSYATIGRD